MGNDRVMKYPLVDVNKIKKNERGFFNFRNDSNNEFVRWNGILLLQLAELIYLTVHYPI